MNRAYLLAIIICKETKYARAVTNALKYHDIQNSAIKIETFLKFAGTKPGALYVNFYFKTTSNSEKGQNFAFRRYIIE